LAKLDTDRETGIIGDRKDIRRRQKFFGDNERTLPTIEPFYESLMEQFRDFNVKLLLVFATLSLILSIWGPEYAWLESLSIYFAVFFAAAIGSVCEWSKNK